MKRSLWEMYKEAFNEASPEFIHWWHFDQGMKTPIEGEHLEQTSFTVAWKAWKAATEKQR